MNATGRQISRSNPSVHHKRQHSDNAIDAFYSYGRSNLSHDFGSRASRGMQRSFNDLGSADALTPQARSRSSSMRKNADEMLLPTHYSPGLLDLHAFDTELLPEAAYNDSEPLFAASKLPNRPGGASDNNLLKSISVDKERTNNVAKIKVVVRKRPLNKKEMTKKEEDIITIERMPNSLTVHETKFKVDLTEYIEKHEFVFDAVLHEGVSNDEVYSETVEPIVPLIFNRTKATCFAYGQTGSGKTYTMQPLPLKASEDILRLVHHTHRNQGFQLFVSFFEIYGGKLYDLLNERKKLFMREDGKQQVCIVGLQEYKVSNVETIKELIERGNASRSTGTTGANEESSRSHAILQLCIKRSVDSSETKPARLVGKLSFIDLAGSERGADTTDNDKQTRIEGAEINKSLLALKECIRALDNDQGHIPFRGSKLTEVLRDSFVGDSRTVMISCISPSSGSCEHTLNTLRYADRVKSLSKGSSTRRDPLYSSSNVRESTASLFSSSLPTEPSFENNKTNLPNDKNRFGWSKQNEREGTPPLNVECVPSNRADIALPHHKRQPSFQNDFTEDDIGYPEQLYEQEKSSWTNTKITETRQVPGFINQKKLINEANRRDIPYVETDSHSDDDLDALLKEEESLVTAHRRQVEQTIDIVREEMNLLVEADQPGSHLDDYIHKLNVILSQKAASIFQLQAQLAQFQKRLDEYNVLVAPSSN
ncbi:kinesin-like protein KIN-13B [Cucurbita pepo subsp. pepo]|uniref:kinesin-like protein KIN-13B n=1 Tax=Cucurbita pepo subsp. pepo TaxID=3664 RepID=UPI000C9D47C9|nr:kinesin-like protein KIN-13B [Cucurbita pepo subsp. pepo]